MRSLVRPLLLSALAIGASASYAATESAPMGRLPNWVLPQSYQLAFKVDPRLPDFSGTTTIKLRLTKASDHLWLHGHDLKVNKVSVIDAAGKSRTGSYSVAAEQEGVARIDFGTELPAQQLTLVIEYAAPLNKQLQGLYKVSHEGQPYAMTQMEPVSARYAFPGFDEPSFKTPFELSLTIPKDEVGVANTRQVAESAAGDGWKTLRFAPTRPLPTYLVAFAVGPWDVVSGPSISPTAYRQQPIELRGVAAHGEGHRMQHVLGETPVIIHTLENYYGFGYPFGKLDLLAAPDFSAGAMENPGLVTFRDWLLLLDPDSAAHYVRGSFNVTAHELAHQWTGDTVTMRWWNDIWLNESFATWMQQKITEKVHPEYRADLDRVHGAQAAMNNDSLVSARKIRQEITGNGDIATAFDGITYEKGAAVLGMFEGYVGEATFQKGMRAYIAAHKFGNASAEDLVDAIARAAGKGDAFKRDFLSFLNQSGVPYVQTKLVQRDGKSVLELSQSRYLPVGSKGDAKRTWGIPICVRYGVIGGSKEACDLLEGPSGSIVLDGAAQTSWVMPNAEARGYYRFGLGKAELAALSKQVGTLSDAEQLAYADAVNASFKHADIDASDALAALKPLANAKTNEVVTAPLALAGWIYRYEARTDAQRAAVAAWVRQAYLPRMTQLGYVRKPGEPDGDAMLRSSLATTLAIEYKLPEVRAALLKQGEAVLKPTAQEPLNFSAANPDLLGVALGVAVQQQGKPALDVLLKQLPATSDPAQRNAILEGLRDIEEVTLANQARDFAISPQVKVGEMATVLSGSRANQAQLDGLWNWFTAHYPQVLARTGSFAGGKLPGLAGSGGCSQADVDRLQAFFQPRLKEITGAARGLAQTSETIELCSALKDKQDPAALSR